MNTNGNLSPAFLRELREVYSSLQPRPLSQAFLSDLKRTYSALPASPIVDFEFLEVHFEAWHRWAQETLRLQLKDLPADDPLRCPISLFRTMDHGRLETAHTRTLAWLLDPTGEHAFGDKLLAALLLHLSTSAAFDMLTVKRVERELRISNDRADASGRLDVFVEGQWSIGMSAPSPWTLVIEAKIDAGEGEG
jgi:hypothetical protein